MFSGMSQVFLLTRSECGVVWGALGKHHHDRMIGTVDGERH